MKISHVPEACYTYTKITCVTRKFEILSIHKGLVVEVRFHVMRNGHDKCTYLRKVALVTVVGFEKFEFDHLSVVATLGRGGRL